MALAALAQGKTLSVLEAGQHLAALPVAITHLPSPYPQALELSTTTARLMEELPKLSLLELGVREAKEQQEAYERATK